MKTTITYQANEPNSTIGYSVTVSTTYSSFCEPEIELLKMHFKDMIGSGVIMEEVFKDDE